MSQPKRQFGWTFCVSVYLAVCLRDKSIGGMSFGDYIFMFWKNGRREMNN